MSAETTSVFPLVNPGKPSSLRRSHSVASESLPTPPSTIRKRPRTGSRSSVFSDDEDAAEDELPRPQSPEPLKKKRRLDEAGKAAALEETPKMKDVFSWHHLQYTVPISGGKTREIQKAVLWPAYEAIKREGPSDDEVMGRLNALWAAQAAEAAAKA